MRLRLFVLCISALSGWTSPVAAVYKDEAYELDFQHALLGSPLLDNTFFHQPSASSRATLLYTLSERNVLGAVNPKDGSLVWRQFLATSPSKGPRGYLRFGNGTSALVSAVGNTVQSWNAADGRLLWQYDDIGTVKSLAIPQLAGKLQDPIVLTEENGNTRITRLNSVNGDVVWQVADNGGEIPLEIASSAHGLYFISLQPAILKGYKLKVTEIHQDTAKILDVQSYGSDGDVSSKDSIIHIGSQVTAPVIVWADKNFKNLKLNVLGTNNIETLHVASKSPIQQIHVHSPSSHSSPNHFLIHYELADSNWAEVYHIDEKTRSIKKAYDMPLVSGKGAFSISAIGTNVLFTRTTKTESLLVLSTSPGVVDKWPLHRQSKSNNTEISGAVSEIVTRGQTGFAIRSALITSDGDLELIRNGESEWLRYEGLAGLSKAAFAEIPMPEGRAQDLADGKHSNIVAAYLHRIIRHLNDLKSLPAWSQLIPLRISNRLFGVSSDFGVESENTFGFRQIIVAATETGRLVGIDAGNGGEIVWSVQAVDIDPNTIWNVTDISIEDGLALVMARDSEFILLEIMTGQIRQYQEPGLIENIDKYISVSHGAAKKTLIPIMANGVPGSIPQGKFSNRTFIVAPQGDSAITGWHVQNGEIPTRAWIFTPPAGQRITAIAARPAHDPVASIGRALGDRNVLYKYLSPNLLLVIAVNDVTFTASVYLLDTVTGEILYSTSHNGVDITEPVSITFSENWFAYTLRTDPVLTHGAPTLNIPKAHILVISELFESPIPNDRGPLGSMANYSSLSSAPYAPHVITASYVTAAPLSHLATSTSKQGITPCTILAYSAPLSAILSIPVSFLSPRRPVGRDATAGEKEEGLFPYQPFLDLNPQWTISHKREIYGIRGILSSPTHMESSSLLFAYGDLDLFGARVAPIGTFDLLGKGFNKAALVLTVGALAFGTRMLQPLAVKKQINALWGQ